MKSPNISQFDNTKTISSVNQTTKQCVMHNFDTNVLVVIHSEIVKQAYVGTICCN